MGSKDRTDKIERKQRGLYRIHGTGVHHSHRLFLRPVAGSGEPAGSGDQPGEYAAYPADRQREAGIRENIKKRDPATEAGAAQGPEGGRHGPAGDPDPYPEPSGYYHPSQND